MLHLLPLGLLDVVLGGALQMGLHLSNKQRGDANVFSKTFRHVLLYVLCKDSFLLCFLFFVEKKLTFGLNPLHTLNTFITSLCTNIARMLKRTERAGLAMSLRKEI